MLPWPAALIAVAGCQPPSEATVTIAVYPAAGRCAIWREQGELAVPCEQLVAYLRDTLKASNERDIAVSLTGADDVSKEDRSVDAIAEQLRTAGFKHVRAVRFGWH